MTYEFVPFDRLHSVGEASLHPDYIKISVGMATCGQAAGAQAVYDALEKRLKLRSGLRAHLSRTGCIGYCAQEPILDVRLPGFGRIFYARATQGLARNIVDALMDGDLPVSQAWAVMETEEVPAENRQRRLPREPICDHLPEFGQIPFFTHQHKIVLRNCGLIDPMQIREYIANGGYQGLLGALEQLQPQQVIDEVVQSGLRGRGGGGFPAGRKWQIARDAPGKSKYVICNADEGDPGAYMDRTILESDPHSVIEGMLIAGYAIGAQQGFIYVRDEYPLAIEQLENALHNARDHRFLGRDIRGTGFDFEIEIIRGAGAFVCGEETAMIASIEGGQGEPRPKPPYPASQGLWGRPTVINNVKTLATVPVILTRGADWYASLGAPGNAGTVVFSLVGQIANTGLVEVPLGMKLGELLEGIGGGSANGKAIKAVQTGGPSGGCLPASLFETPITYETMKATGSIMGSGGMVVLDESACMVDVARYFLDFTQIESCGKCTACREGTRHMKDILTRFTHGEGRPGDLALLEEVALAVQAGSLCGLGQTAPNPVLSTLRYFRDEYEAHIQGKTCPAGKCTLQVEV